MLDYVLAPAAWALPGPTGPAPCVLHVDEHWRITDADHLLLWTSVPHPAARVQPPAARCRRVARTGLFKAAGNRQQREAADAHVRAYQAALGQSLHGYDGMVQNLASQVASGQLTALEACRLAKQVLCAKIWEAVDASVGSREVRRGVCMPRPCVYTDAVKEAVQARRAADDELAGAPGGAPGGGAVLAAGATAAPQ